MPPDTVAAQKKNRHTPSRIHHLKLAFASGTTPLVGKPSTPISKNPKMVTAAKGSVPTEVETKDSINSRVMDGDALKKSNSEIVPATVSGGTDDEPALDPATVSSAVSAGVSTLSNTNFTVEEAPKTIHRNTRCNGIPLETLTEALSRAIVTVQSAFTTDRPTNPAILTAIAWHIAEFRPTPRTHGFILGVPAQDVYNSLVGSQPEITVRRIARAWSPAISKVLLYKSMQPTPVFTSQVNEIFHNMYDKLAVAPYCFDGIDPSIIPAHVSRLIAVGLSYYKRSKSSSPYTFLNRPISIADTVEDYNGIYAGN